MDLEEKENPEEKIDVKEKTDLQIEDTGGGETNFQTQPQNVDYTTKPKLFSTTDFGQYFTKSATVASCKRTSSNAAHGDFSDDVRAYSYEHKYRSNTSVV